MKLCNQTLNAVPKTVSVPSYNRGDVKVGIVHFGVGGFHRAHQAMYVDQLMEKGIGLSWGICGVGVLPSDYKMRDALKAQDCLYTLVVKNSDGAYTARVIGSIVDYLLAADDPEKVIELMASEDIKVVSLTITEGGYNFHHVTGEFDFENVDVKHDLNNGVDPITVFGYVTEALKRRYERGIKPFTVMSCDNIQSNGEVAKKMFVAFAKRKNSTIGKWIEENVLFPNSMVDRITPVTLPDDIDTVKNKFNIDDQWPVVCEPFTQWVLEDHFSDGRPSYESAGVQLVEDVVPYELMKLRLLNASHQALTYFGYLSGYRYAHEVTQDPDFERFLLDYMEKEGSPTLRAVPGVDLDNYRKTLISRFANPEVKDTLARLCAESSDRIPKWLLPVVRENLQKGGEIKRSAAVVASWSRYAEGFDEQGNSINVVDRMKEKIMASAACNNKNILAFIENREVFGDLIDHPEFVASYKDALESLHKIGAKATVKKLLA